MADPAGAPLTLAVATHRAHHNKSGDFPSEAQTPWSNRDWTPLELIDWISSGKAWLACHLTDGRRCQDSASSSDLIVLDIDGDLSLEAFWGIASAARHCLFTATTCSHSAAEHRFRAVFRCERHDDPQLHKAIYHQLLAALGLTLKDNSGEKPERLWFGNDAAEIQYGQGEPLSWELIENARDALKAAAKARLTTTAAPIDNSNDQELDNRRAAWVLEHLLRPSADGEFQAYWSPLLNAAAATADEAVAEAFLAWHSRGHHSKTQQRVAKRLESAGTRLSAGEGAGRILKFAKEQHGKDWWQQLPQELRYGGGGAQTPPQPRSLASARSLADTLPPATGGPVSFSASHSATVPDHVPSPEELQRLATEATPRLIASSAHSTEQNTSTAARIRQLIELIYWLKIENIHRGPGGNEVLTEEDSDYQIDEYTSELLSFPVFQRQPERIELRLLQEFRRQHGVVGRSRSNIKARHLYDTTEDDKLPMIGGLMARGCSYILYAKQGIGKTKLAFLLCRSAAGTPGHSTFLDFRPVPQEVWRKERVLYIASDGDENAGADLRRYSDSMKQRDAQWLDSFDVIDGSVEHKATRWRIDLYELHLLAKMLDAALAAGTPYRLVVIDSLKAVTPDGKRVGDQIITDYVSLVNSICSPRNVTVLYVHHQAKEGDNAQGAAGLLEMVHGVFRLKEENNQTFFCIDKTRLDPRGRREIPYQITSDGNLKIATYAADDQADEDGRELILRAFQQHYDKHLHRVAHLHKTDQSRIYGGINRSDYMLLLRAAGPTHSSWTSLRSVNDIINQMVKDGLLKRLKNKQVAVAGADPFTQVTTEQLQFKAQLDQADDEDNSGDLPGW